MRGDIGHIKFRERRFRRARIIVGRAANQRKARQGNKSVNRGCAIPGEEGIDGRPAIKPGSEGRDHI